MAHTRRRAASSVGTDPQRNRYAAFFHGLLARGVYLAPSQFETAFLSLADSPDDVSTTVDLARRVLTA